MDTEKSRELWNRLENEPERAYRAFESYLTLPSNDRTILAAYRSHVGNPEAAKPSDTWGSWSKQYAWRERAAAYDDHLTSLRREAYERGVEEEAERQGAIAERNRNRTNELMTLAYEKAMDWFESAEPSDLRPQDVVQIIKLHLEAVKTFGVAEKPEEDDWTEEDDTEFLERMAKDAEIFERDLDDESKGAEEAEEGDAYGDQGDADEK